MKNSCQLALLAALGLASVTVAQAQSFSGSPSTGDLVVGIYDASVTDTYLIDLGAISPLSLTAGETFNLNSSTYGSLLTSVSLDASTEFGVVETAGNGSLKGSGTAYYTSTTIPGTLSKANPWNAINNALLSQTLGAETAGSSTAVDYQADPANNSTLGAALGGSSYLVPSSTAENFYGIVDNGSSPVVQDTFSFNPTTDTLTVTATPEPSTFGLIAFAGLAIFVLRNKLSSKQA